MDFQIRITEAALADFEEILAAKIENRPSKAFQQDVYHIAMRLVVAFVLILLPICAQEKQEQGRKPPPDPTNLKVLKVSKGPEVVQIMRTFTAGLGVQCSYCHVQGNFASDENPKKEIARHMIEMTTLVNSKFPDGKMRVTCYTCHRGEAEPKTAPEAKPAP